MTKTVIVNAWEKSSRTLCKCGQIADNYFCPKVRKSRFVQNSGIAFFSYQMNSESFGFFPIQSHQLGGLNDSSYDQMDHH